MHLHSRPRNHEGAGNAGCRCTRMSRVQESAKNAHEPSQVQPNTPAFPARCLTTYTVLSSAYRALLVAVPPGLSTRRLTPASGCRDHTASSNASARFVNPRAICVHRNPPRVRDDAYAPHVEAGWRELYF